MFLHASMQETVVLDTTGRGAWVQDPAHAVGRRYGLWRQHVVHQVRMCQQEHWRQDSCGWWVGAMAQVMVVIVRKQDNAVS